MREERKTVNLDAYEEGAVQAVGLGLLVLFFVVGVMKTLGSFAEMKRPEVVLKMFIRFVLAKAAVTYGLDLMMALFTIVQGLIYHYGRVRIGGGYRGLELCCGTYFQYARTCRNSQNG